MHENFRVAVVALRGMWAHRWLGLATAWVAGATALAAIMVQPTKYEASARIFANTDSILKPLMTGLTGPAGLPTKLTVFRKCTRRVISS